RPAIPGAGCVPAPEGPSQMWIERNRVMKVRTCLAQTVVGMTVVTALLCCGSPVSAQRVVTIDENGNGSMTLGGVTAPLSTVPGQPTLAYLLPFNTLGGDLEALEPGSGFLSDLIRFLPNTVS